MSDDPHRLSRLVADRVRAVAWRGVDVMRVWKSWRERLKDVGEAELLDAMNWSKCPVGEQRKKFGQKIIAYKFATCFLPKDPELVRLGGDFVDCLFAHNGWAAEQILGRIQARALELKRIFDEAR